MVGLGLTSLSLPALAQIQPPSGTATYNQGRTSAAIVPSDAVVFPATRALFIGAASSCNIALSLVGDNSVALTWSNVQPGQFLALSAVRVFATNTTCTNIIAIW